MPRRPRDHDNDEESSQSGMNDGDRRPSRAAKARAMGTLRSWRDAEVALDVALSEPRKRRLPPVAPEPEPEPEPEESPFENPASTVKSKAERTIIVIGLSPASFTGEILRIWPKKPTRKIRLVWINKCDEPPKLPEKWVWHEVHKTAGEGLLIEAALGGKCTEAWGELFVIMGAGTSIQDFTALKEDDSNLYPFDKELLQASVEVDVLDRRGLLIEPLCMQTLRFMAGLRKAFLEKTLPGFHQWMQAHKDRIVGVLTFNIDSLEFIALPPELHNRIMQFHGNIHQLTTIEALHNQYQGRAVTDKQKSPRVWWDPEALNRIANCPDTRLVDVILDPNSSVYMCSIGGPEGNNNGRPKRQKALLGDGQNIEEYAKILASGGDVPDLSTGELHKVNVFLRQRVRAMYLGNCVFTGENNDAKLARCSTSFLRAFVVGDSEWEKYEKDIKIVNEQRGLSGGAEDEPPALSPPPPPSPVPLMEEKIEVTQMMSIDAAGGQSAVVILEEQTTQVIKSQDELDEEELQQHQAIRQKHFQSLLQQRQQQQQKQQPFSLQPQYAYPPYPPQPFQHHPPPPQPMYHFSQQEYYNGSLHHPAHAYPPIQYGQQYPSHPYQQPGQSGPLPCFYPPQQQPIQPQFTPPYFQQTTHLHMPPDLVGQQQRQGTKGGIGRGKGGCVKGSGCKDEWL